MVGSSRRRIPLCLPGLLGRLGWAGTKLACFLSPYHPTHFSSLALYISQTCTDHCPGYPQRVVKARNPSIWLVDWCVPLHALLLSCLSLVLLSKAPDLSGHPRSIIVHTHALSQSLVLPIRPESTVWRSLRPRSLRLLYTLRRQASLTGHALVSIKA